MQRKRSFLILWFGAFVNWMGYGFVYPIFAVSLFEPNPVIAVGDSTLYRGVLLGVLLAATPIGQFFTSPFIGTLSDHKGRKPVLHWTYWLIFAGYVLSAWGVSLASVVLIIVGRVVTGFGAGNLGVINSAVTDISTPQEKTKNYALIAMASGIGFTVGPFLGGKLMAFGPMVPFVFASGASGLAALCFRFVFHETLTYPLESKKYTLGMQVHELLSIRKDRKLSVFYCAFFVFCLGWSFYWEFVPVTWIKKYGLDASGIGDFYAFGSLFYVLSSGLLIRPIVKRFKPTPTLIIALGALVFCLVPLFFAPLNGYWIGIPLQQFCVALIFPLGTTIVSNAASDHRQGRVLGTFQSLQALAFAATPFLGGALLDVSYAIPVLVGGAAMLIACLVLFLSFKRG